jgi:type VI secretion system secreted protein Hcp
MNTVLRASVVAAALLATASLGSAQVTRQTLIRPQAPQMSARSGAQLYVTVDGTKQGRFKGQSSSARWQNAVPALAFAYEVGMPRDAARSIATASRVHGPVVITKAVGAASPQFFTAMTTGETLKSVVLEFVRADANGAEEVFYTIKLTGATASRFRQYMAAPEAGNPAGSGLLEEISFTFQRIEMTSADGSTMAMDDWGR